MLKVNVGLSRKVGEANFGSRGASVNLELELESDLINSADRLQDRIRQLFRLAKASVNEELNANGLATGTEEGNGRNGNRRGRPSRPATQSQARVIHAIADRQRVDLPGLLRNRFQVAAPADLIVRALDSGVVPATQVPWVLAEWGQPRHREFVEGGRTAWRLFNGFTEVLKGCNLAMLPRRTQALHGLRDAACGLSPAR